LKQTIPIKKSTREAINSMLGSSLKEVVAENGYRPDRPMIKPADLDLMNDARLQQLGSLRLPLVDLQARGIRESRQLGDRLAADS